MSSEPGIEMVICNLSTKLANGSTSRVMVMSIEDDVAEYREERAAIGEYERDMTRYDAERAASELAESYRRWLRARDAYYQHKWSAPERIAKLCSDIDAIKHDVAISVRDVSEVDGGRLEIALVDKAGDK